ncbi:MAG: hypothetical protein JWN96_2128, partial [Mycobacterium sp.]|nr:hypothetical protein [Mycobacterium sp.]
MLAWIKRALAKPFNWSGWPKVASIATAFTAVAALFFSAQSLRSTQNQYALSEQGQLSERFSKSIEQLGSDKTDVKLGGIYSLEKLARDSQSDGPVVFEVLSAYVRTHGGQPAPGQQVTRCPQIRTTAVDIQAALTVIGRRAHPAVRRQGIDLSKTEWGYTHRDDQRIDLSRAALHDANLDGAYLAGVDLRETDLSCVEMSGANLRGG